MGSVHRNKKKNYKINPCTAKSRVRGPGNKMCGQSRAGGTGRRAARGDAHPRRLPSSSPHPTRKLFPPSFPVPERLVVNLGGADTDGVVPVGRLVPHLGEEELQGPLVDPRVGCCPLMDRGEKMGRENTLLHFSLQSPKRAAQTPWQQPSPSLVHPRSEPATSLVRGGC